MSGAIYHVTDSENVPSILRDGLTPQIGPRSQACCEPNNRVFFFATISAVEDALGSWLGSALEDCGSLSLLSIEPSNLEMVSDAGFELSTNTPVPPNKISVIVGPNLPRGAATGFEHLAWISHNDDIEDAA